MHKVKLQRLRSSDQGTPGIVTFLGHALFSLELPGRQNKRSISRIPAGTYAVRWSYSPTFKRKMYLLDNVPNRSGIRIHAGNWAGDSKLGYKTDSYGCPLLGYRFAFDTKQEQLLNSAKAVLFFEQALNYEPFELEILDVAGD